MWLPIGNLTEKNVLNPFLDRWMCGSEEKHFKIVYILEDICLQRLMWEEQSFLITYLKIHKLQRKRKEYWIWDDFGAHISRTVHPIWTEFLYRIYHMHIVISQSCPVLIDSDWVHRTKSEVPEKYLKKVHISIIIHIFNGNWNSGTRKYGKQVEEN